MRKDNSYAYPDPAIVPDSICIRAYIPDHPLYIGAFWQAYTYFGRWLAWQRDSANTAAAVAAMWRTLIEQSRAEFEAGGGCGMILNCADVERCLIPTPDPPYTAPLPDGRSASEGMLDDTLWFLYSVIDEINDRIALGQSIEQIAVELANEIQAKSGKWVYPELLGLVQNLYTRPQSERDAMLNVANWQPVREAASCNQELVAGADYGNYVDWLNSLADTLVAALNAASDTLKDSLNDLAIVLSGETGGALGNASLAADGGGAGFGGTPIGVCDTVYLKPYQWCEAFIPVGGEVEYPATEPIARIQGGADITVKIQWKVDFVHPADGGACFAQGFYELDWVSASGSGTITAVALCQEDGTDGDWWLGSRENVFNNVSPDDMTITAVRFRLTNGNQSTGAATSCFRSLSITTVWV